MKYNKNVLSCSNSTWFNTLMFLRHSILKTTKKAGPPTVTSLFTREKGNHTHQPLQRTQSWINSPGPRVTLIGSFINLALVGGKAGAGILSGSSAMVADAAHSLGDLVSDAVALGALRIASIPPDEDHPYGHGKYENIGAFGVSVLLCGTGCGVGWHSVELMSMLFNSTDPLNEISNAKDSLYLLAGIAASSSIIVKEGLYRYTKEIGTEMGSPVLIANAYHHRSDALSSVVALGGIGGTMAGLPWLDPVAGLVVSLMIVKSAFEIGWESIIQLTDTVDKKLMKSVANEIQSFVSESRGVTSFSHLRARRNGSDALVDVHIVVEPMLTISAAHILAELVRYRIVSNIEEVVDVTIQIDPEKEYEHDFNHIDLLNIISNPLQIESEVKDTLMSDHVKHGILSVTHVGVHVLKKKVTVEVTIEVDASSTVREASEIAANARRKLELIQNISYADIHLELDDGGDILRRERNAAKIR